MPYIQQVEYTPPGVRALAGIASILAEGATNKLESSDYKASQDYMQKYFNRAPGAAAPPPPLFKSTRFRQWFSQVGPQMAEQARQEGLIKDSQAKSAQAAALAFSGLKGVSPEEATAFQSVLNADPANAGGYLAMYAQNHLMNQQQAKATDLTTRGNKVQEKLNSLIQQSQNSTLADPAGAVQSAIAGNEDIPGIAQMGGQALQQIQARQLNAQQLGMVQSLRQSMANDPAYKNNPMLGEVGMMALAQGDSSTAEYALADMYGNYADAQKAAAKDKPLDASQVPAYLDNIGNNYAGMFAMKGLGARSSERGAKDYNDWAGGVLDEALTGLADPAKLSAAVDSAMNQVDPEVLGSFPRNYIRNYLSSSILRHIGDRRAAFNKKPGIVINAMPAGGQ